MCQFIESIAYKDGMLLNLDHHQKRIDRTLDHHYINIKINLFEIKLPFKSGLHKCRIVYDRNIEEVELTPYFIKKIENIKLVSANINYQFKYANRQLFKNLVEKNSNYDDVIIVKQGMITDSSYANVCLFDGSGWFTPDQPLLEGTKRARLLSSKDIQKKAIKPKDLKQYKKISLINAMLDLGDIELPIESLVGL
ncbi:MAG TPA: aminotransferase class IV [Cyclobacteriaceae bacterium]